MGKFTRSIIGGVSCLVLVIGCSSSVEPEAKAGSAGAGARSASAAAVETVATMLEVAEAGNWERYVDEFYGEKDKFGSAADRDKLVSRFRDQWGSQVLTGLRGAKAVEPTVSEDGRRASFPIEGGEFLLYLDDAAKWTFHL